MQYKIHLNNKLEFNSDTNTIESKDSSMSSTWKTILW